MILRSDYWLKLSEEQPEKNQLIWHVDTLNPDVMPKLITWKPRKKIYPGEFWCPLSCSPSPKTQ